MFKRMIKLLLVVLIIWGILFILNIFRCINYKTPILYLYSIEDEYSCTYKCLGYSVDISKRNHTIIKTKMNFLNIKLFETNYLYEIKSNRKIENVHISTIENSISKEGVDIVVIDDNEDSYAWTDNYKIEKKNNDQWNEIKPYKDVIIPEINYNKNENNEIFFEINWSDNYGELSSGIYRIGKTVYDNGEYIIIYSDEFEIQ